MAAKNTRQEILNIAQDLLRADGLSGISFDTIAQHLGRTKQAVLYWYPTKQDLLAAMFLPMLQAEADVAIKAVAGKGSRSNVIAAFVRSVSSFHLGDLDRFRMMYLLPQTIRPNTAQKTGPTLVDKVHPVTDAMYSAFANALGPGLPNAREDALAIHSSVLGLVMMFGLADRLQDPLKHGPDRLIDSLIRSLAGH